MSQCNHVERWKCSIPGHDFGGSCDACGAEWDCPTCETETRDAVIAALRSERDAALAEGARMRPVVEAAEADYAGLGDEHTLMKAVRRYREAQP
jgi:hypothetical protein